MTGSDRPAAQARPTLVPTCEAVAGRSPVPVSVALIAAWLVVTLTTYWAHHGFSTAAAIAYVFLTVVLAGQPRNVLVTNLRPVISTTLVISAVGLLLRGGYGSQLPAAAEFVTVATTTVCMLVVAVLVLVRRPAFDSAAIHLSVIMLLALNSYVIVTTTPSIDVWNFTNQAAAAFPHENFYGKAWSGVSPHPAPYVVTEGFPYLPMGVVLLAPFEWLTGDIRWGLLTCLLAAGLAVLHRHRGTDAALLALLLWTTPGNLLMIESAWNETILLALLLPALLCYSRGKSTLGTVLLVLALATKQHAWVILPVLAAWTAVGPRRAAQAACGAAILCLPWWISDLSAFLQDTVRFHIDMAPRPDATTLYIWALRLGWEPPFWLSATILAASVAVISYLVHRRQPGLSGISAALALTLLVANLVNKQAFLNQYWLVASLLLFAAPLDRAVTGRSASGPESTVSATGAHVLDGDVVGAPPSQ